MRVSLLAFPARARFLAAVGMVLVMGLPPVAGQEAWDVRLSDPDPRARVRAIRQLSASAEAFQHLDALDRLLEDVSEEVRMAVVTALVKLRTVEAEPSLIGATRDAEVRVQMLAVDGLVDFYLPNYVKTGWRSRVSVFASSMKRRLVDPDPETVAPYVQVSPEALQAIGAVIRDGASDESRANAAHAAGVLLGRAVLDDLLEGVRSRRPVVMLESVLAIKSLQEVSAGPEIVFLLRDPDPVIREAAARTLGQLRTQEAVEGLTFMVEHDEKPAIREQALVALAKIPDNGQRELFLRHLSHKNNALRAAAAEGIGREGNPDDSVVVERLLSMEKAAGTRLSLAFAAVHLGNLERMERLVKALDSMSQRAVARAFLIELARREDVLDRLHYLLPAGSTAQRRQLAHVIARSGTEASVEHLERLVRDRNAGVAQAAVEELKVLRDRLAQ